MDNRRKKLENPMLRGYFISTAHKNKIPTAVPIFSGMTFSTAIIFTSPGVAVTPEINMADKKTEVVSVWQMLLISQRFKTIIVYFIFRGCRRHRS